MRLAFARISPVGRPDSSRMSSNSSTRKRLARESPAPHDGENHYAEACNLKPVASKKGASLTTVVIASYFEEEYVRRIEEVDGRLRVLYREDLVPPPRWPGDHAGPAEWERSPGDEEAFLRMLGEAEVLYDFPRGHMEDLVRVAPTSGGCRGAWRGPGRWPRWPDWARPTWW